MKIKAHFLPDIYDVALVTDEDYPDKIEIQLLDQQGVIVEGGQFDLADFLQHIMEFYDKNY